MVFSRRQAAGPGPGHPPSAVPGAGVPRARSDAGSHFPTSDSRHPAPSRPTAGATRCPAVSAAWMFADTLTPLVRTGCSSSSPDLRPPRLRPTFPQEELLLARLEEIPGVRLRPTRTIAPALARAAVLSSSSPLPLWSLLIPKLDPVSLRSRPSSAHSSPVPALRFILSRNRSPPKWSLAQPAQVAVNNQGPGGPHGLALTFHIVPLELEVRGQRGAAWFPLRPCRRVCPCPPTSGGLLAIAGAPWGVDATPVSASVSARGPLLRVCATCVRVMGVTVEIDTLCFDSTA